MVAVAVAVAGGRKVMVVVGKEEERWRRIEGKKKEIST